MDASSNSNPSSGGDGGGEGSASSGESIGGQLLNAGDPPPRPADPIPRGQGRYEFSFHVPLNPAGLGAGGGGPAGQEQHPSLTIQFEFGFGPGARPPGFGPMPPEQWRAQRQQQGEALGAAGQAGPRVAQGAPGFERVSQGRSLGPHSQYPPGMNAEPAQPPLSEAARDSANPPPLDAPAPAPAPGNPPVLPSERFHLPLPFPTMQAGRPQLPTTDFPFPFFLDALLPSAPVADPARAVELLRGLKDPGADMMRRIDRVTRAESGEEFKCAVCMEAWEDEVVAMEGGGGDADMGAGAVGTQADEGEVEKLLNPSAETSVEPDEENMPEGGQTSMRAFPCCHIFHEGCLEPWLQSKTTCPSCRFDIDPLSTTLRRPGGNRARFQTFRPGATQNDNAGQRDRPYAARPAPAPNAEAGAAAAANAPQGPRAPRAPPTLEGPPRGPPQRVADLAEALRDFATQALPGFAPEGVPVDGAQHRGDGPTWTDEARNTLREQILRSREWERTQAGPSAVQNSEAAGSEARAVASAAAQSATSGSIAPQPAQPAINSSTAETLLSQTAGSAGPAAQPPANPPAPTQGTQQGNPGHTGNPAPALFPLLGSFHFSLVPPTVGAPDGPGSHFTQVAWPSHQAPPSANNNAEDAPPGPPAGDEGGSPEAPAAQPAHQPPQGDDALPIIPPHIDMTAVWATALGTMRRLLPPHLLVGIPAQMPGEVAAAQAAPAQSAQPAQPAQPAQLAMPSAPAAPAAPPAPSASSAPAQPASPAAPSMPAQASAGSLAATVEDISDAPQEDQPEPANDNAPIPHVPLIPIHVVQVMQGAAPVLGNPIGFAGPPPMRRIRSTGPGGESSASLPRANDLPPPPRRQWLPPAGKLTLDEWVTLREKALHWRCDDPVCLFAPPEHLSDLPVKKWNDWAPTEERCQPLISMEQKQAVVSSGDTETAGFNLLACPHACHLSCVRTTARSSGWWSKGEDGRRLCRCPKCRKQGWIEDDVEETPMEGIEATA